MEARSRKLERFVLLKMLGRRQLDAEEMGRLVKYFYGVEPKRWCNKGSVLEDLIGRCRCRGGIAVGDHVMDLFDLDIEFWNVEIDSE